VNIILQRCTCHNVNWQSRPFVSKR